MFCCRHHQSISHKHRHAQQAYRTNWDPSYTNIGTNWSRINTQYGLFRRIKVKVKTNTRENWKKTYPSGTHERSFDPLEKSRWEIVEPPSSTNCRLVWSHCTSSRPRSRASNLRLLSPVKHDPAPRVRWVGGGDPPEGLRAGGQGGAAWDAAATPAASLVRAASPEKASSEWVGRGKGNG